MTLKQINLRLPEELLKAIDKEAHSNHIDRSSWIRTTLQAALTGSSKSPELVDAIKVVDPRAREVIKDVIARVEKLEEHCFNAADPFG